MRVWALATAFLCAMTVLAGCAEKGEPDDAAMEDTPLPTVPDRRVHTGGTFGTQVCEGPSCVSLNHQAPSPVDLPVNASVVSVALEATFTGDGQAPDVVWTITCRVGTRACGDDAETTVDGTLPLVFEGAPAWPSGATLSFTVDPKTVALPGTGFLIDGTVVLEALPGYEVPEVDEDRDPA